jgi:hypothetical protein
MQPPAPMRGARWSNFFFRLQSRPQQEDGHVTQAPSLRMLTWRPQTPRDDPPCGSSPRKSALKSQLGEQFLQFYRLRKVEVKTRRLSLLFVFRLSPARQRSKTRAIVPLPF